jgi:hypothetical protein
VEKRHLKNSDNKDVNAEIADVRINIVYALQQETNVQ